MLLLPDLSDKYMLLLPDLSDKYMLRYLTNTKRNMTIDTDSTMKITVAVAIIHPGPHNLKKIIIIFWLKALI